MVVNDNAISFESFDFIGLKNEIALTSITRLYRLLFAIIISRAIKKTRSYEISQILETLAYLG